MTLNQILSHFEGVKGGGGQYMAHCPCHNDRHQSLSIAEGDKGILLNCHAGCGTRGILDRVGLKPSDLFYEERPKRQPTDKPQIVAVYNYPNGAQKVRRSDKSFLWKQPDGQGGWKWSRKGLPHVLYQKGELSSPVLIAEGEKDVDNLHKLGFDAVSGEDGAGPDKWRREYTEQLAGKQVVIFPDHDQVGQEYAQEVAAALSPVCPVVKLVDLSTVWPEIPEHGDVSDLITTFGSNQAAGMITGLMLDAPEWEPPKELPAPEEQRPTLQTISAADLQNKEIPPIQWAVEKLLPVGLNLLASPPKFGKSWMMLDLCLSVAAGRPFLGYTTNKSGCLYLALEDSERRLKSRMNKVLRGRQAPTDFHFATTANTLDDGLFHELESFLKEHPETQLVVIDTFQKVRGAVHGKEGAYATDYREAGALKAFADKQNICLLLVHHLRKMKDDGDPFERISGTNGIMGAADTALVLTREKRSDSNTTMSVVGRDVDGGSTVLRFNKELCAWDNLGDADLLARMQARQEYDISPIVKTIKKLVEQSPAGWIGTSKQLMEAGLFMTHTHLATSPRELTSKLKPLIPLMFDYDQIMYEPKSNGTGGGKHRFYSSQLEELDPMEPVPFP